MKLVLLPGMDGTGRLFEPLLNFLPAWLAPIVIAYPRIRDADMPNCCRLSRRRSPPGRTTSSLESRFPVPSPSCWRPGVRPVCGASFFVHLLPAALCPRSHASFVA